ncbi:MAG: tRNA dihydrouridine(20/20a) synthase DusA [Rickettsiales bacterium]|nr:tRNA dihydrouridine(20/20a) synthase DusA [Rickettsiales bacterium]
MTNKTKINRLFSVAPMMAWTDRHCRYFHRLISPSSLLYTVMITSGALKHGDAAFHLDYNDDYEPPVALQLGGSEPQEMAMAAKLGGQWNYDEININCGCPSERVQKGAFGACLMAEPNLIKECVSAMRQETDKEITVKTRIGIDNQDSYEFLVEFIEQAAKGGCESFTIHARKAWLKGLSPKENRDIPPLHYDRVYKLKQDFPELEIIINGGIKTIDEMQEHIKQCDGVMVGREAYSNPWLLKDVEEQLFKNKVIKTKLQIVEEMAIYAQKEIDEGRAQLKDIARHMLGLYQNCAGAKAWRRTLSTKVYEEPTNVQILIDAAQEVEQAIIKRAQEYPETSAA